MNQLEKNLINPLAKTLFNVPIAIFRSGLNSLVGLGVYTKNYCAFVNCLGNEKKYNLNFQIGSGVTN